MSLISDLRRPGTPVRRFFERELPYTEFVVREVAPYLRGGRRTAQLPSSHPARNALRGTALDSLFRFALAEQPLPTLSPGMSVGGLAPPVISAASSALGHAAQHALQLRAFAREVSDEDWEDLARVSLLLATFEQAHRSGRPSTAMLEITKAPPDWRWWAQALVTSDDVEDVAIVGAAAAADHGRLRGRIRYCNPTFALSSGLGGADADFITNDGLLVDLKSTEQTRTCTSQDVWQLCGYALADVDDRYEITDVGLFQLRWRTHKTWGLASLLQQLAGTEIAPAELRHRFTQALAVPGSRPDPTSDGKR